jgi:ABC-2 type transport system permease protein
MLLLVARINRPALPVIGVLNVGFALGLVLGFGYVIPDISETTALFLVTGAATQMVVTVALVMLPQVISQMRYGKILDYFMALPMNREAFFAAYVLYSLAVTLPGIVFALAVGAWHYDFSLDIEPLVVVAVPLIVVALAGFGIAVGTLSPHPQLTNTITNLIIFYVLFFSPVIAPASQLPGWLQGAGDVLPTTYAADAVRATTSDLPGTNLGQSFAVLGAYAVVSLGVASLVVRRRR